MQENVALSAVPIQLSGIFESVRDPGAGGIDIFLGTTRKTSGGKEVIALEYEAYEPMALQKFHELAAEASGKWRLRKVTIVHRTGRVAVGDISVAIAVAAVHRAEAFEACRWLIDGLKKYAPIWKKELYRDGSEWVDGFTG
ncbi:MAG TPA: molybdenum cofactor biosynthesis protein MoaE [Bacteroidota bacterium]|nr:molybdenum cofactor biosynthesis protein MoaE [Bacteroidota bacterium]